MAEPKNRSRILILSHLAQFSLLRRFGDRVYGGLAEMAFSAEGESIPGDLVALQSAPPSKWYLGWLVSKQWLQGHADQTFTIESIEDGELCDWSNVGVIHYNRSTVAEHPSWRWSDEQHEFNDRWHKICRTERDAYIYLPTQADFRPDDSGVTLGVRVRFGLREERSLRSFSDWTTLTDSEMLAFYDEAAATLGKSPAK